MTTPISTSYPTTNTHPTAIQYPQQTHRLQQQQRTLATSSGSNYNSRDDHHINYSTMTQFVIGPSYYNAHSPNSSSTIPSTTSLTHGKNVQFDFPPELTTTTAPMMTTSCASSSFSTTSSSGSGKENTNTMQLQISKNQNRYDNIPSTTESALVVPHQNRNVPKIRVPISSNAHGSDSVHPMKKKMKKQRKQKTALGAVSGMVVGGISLGPAGVLLGAGVGAIATKQICKMGERRAQRNYEQQSFQTTAYQKSQSWNTNSNVVFT